jgi:hypothetical protein
MKKSNEVEQSSQMEETTMGDSVLSLFKWFAIGGLLYFPFVAIVLALTNPNPNKKKEEWTRQTSTHFPEIYRDESQLFILRLNERYQHLLEK